MDKRLKLRSRGADSPHMSELLDWCGLAAGGVLLVAFLVAGWEHLQREAFAVLRLQSPDGRWLSRPPPHPDMPQAAAVDLVLDTVAEPTSDSQLNASHAAMSLALSRAAGARQPRDSSPWLDTCPQITVGVEIGADGSAGPAANVEPAAPSALPAPSPAPEVAQAEQPQQTTIERAALR